MAEVQNVCIRWQISSPSNTAGSATSRRWSKEHFMTVANKTKAKHETEMKKKRPDKENRKQPHSSHLLRKCDRACRWLNPFRAHLIAIANSSHRIPPVRVEAAVYLSSQCPALKRIIIIGKLDLIVLELNIPRRKRQL